MEVQQLRSELARLCCIAGARVRQAVHAVPLRDRAQRVPARLKPPPEQSAYVDVVGEEAIVACLSHFAEQHPTLCFRVVQQYEPQRYFTIGDPQAAQQVWMFADAVDGTVKLAGLGNEAGVLRLVNDGAWAMGLAFTDPSPAAELAQLTLADVTVAALVDGNPPTTPLYPTTVVALREGVGWATYGCEEGCSGGGGGAAAAGQGAAAAGDAGEEVVGAGGGGAQEGTVAGGGEGAAAAVWARRVRLRTSSIGVLGQAAVYYDAFQAFDRRTAAAGDERLAGALYARLINRHEGGAFDVWRTYGNLACVLRGMLAPLPPSSSSGPAIEPQVGAFVVVNENLPNLLPVVPVLLGAGGCAATLGGEPLSAWPLARGRSSVVYAGNAALLDSVLRLVRQAAGASGDA